MNGKPYIGQIIEHKVFGETVRERIIEIECVIGDQYRVRVEPVSVAGYVAIGLSHAIKGGTPCAR